MATALPFWKQQIGKRIKKIDLKQLIIEQIKLVNQDKPYFQRVNFPWHKFNFLIFSFKMSNHVNILMNCKAFDAEKYNKLDKSGEYAIVMYLKRAYRNDYTNPNKAILYFPLTILNQLTYSDLLNELGLIPSLDEETPYQDYDTLKTRLKWLDIPYEERFIQGLEENETIKDIVSLLIRNETKIAGYRLTGNDNKNEYLEVDQISSTYLCKRDKLHERDENIRTYDWVTLSGINFIYELDEIPNGPAFEFGEVDRVYFTRNEN